MTNCGTYTWKVSVLRLREYGEEKSRSGNVNVISSREWFSGIKFSCRSTNCNRVQWDWKSRLFSSLPYLLSTYRYLLTQRRTLGLFSFWQNHHFKYHTWSSVFNSVVTRFIICRQKSPNCFSKKYWKSYDYHWHKS